MIKRILEKKIKENLFKGKVLVLYGARQVGKTTLLKSIQNDITVPSLFLNCDEPEVRAALTNRTSTEMKKYIGDARLVIIDEAQRIENIGLTLKLLIDTYPGTQVIASGSSSFDLANRIVEPLTGRKVEYTLYPISYAEMEDARGEREAARLVEAYCTYGMYPRAVLSGADAARAVVEELTTSYLYKDILALGAVRKPDLLEKILQALALQIGSEVSLTELGSLVGARKETVDRYMTLLEQTFVLFRLPPLARNLRNEIAKSRKVYFWDLGVRNSIINNFNPLHLRQDVGGLWENFLIAERLKRNAYQGEKANSFFWRTYDQKEIDYIEERDGALHAFECKWGSGTPRKSKAFLEEYTNSDFTLITRETFPTFVR